VCRVRWSLLLGSVRASVRLSNRLFPSLKMSSSFVLNDTPLIEASPPKTMWSILPEGVNKIIVFRGKKLTHKLFVVINRSELKFIVKKYERGALWKFISVHFNGCADLNFHSIPKHSAACTWWKLNAAPQRVLGRADKVIK